MFARLNAFSVPIALAVILAGCAIDQTNSPFISAEPEEGSVLTRAPRTLRLYFEKLPDVPRSTVSLQGPTGELNIRGMHTMGANDLMMEINDQVEDGEYTVYWTSYVGDDPKEYQGEFSFTVQAN
ncbi:MAG: copper resistance protein CopC [Gammaproteobacteria bacterium]|nr:copper resistance protein CopC [Gammaproteobacteria bacterium]